jgi:hypothetical protein
MSASQQAQKPPTKSSDEAKQKQLRLAREQGYAFERTVKEMTQDKAHRAAQHAEDFLVGCAVEHTEGMHHMELVEFGKVRIETGQKLSWARSSDGSR